MTPEQRDLVERLRMLCAGEGASAVREVKMFGAVCFMVRDKIAVCAMKDGGLLARVTDAKHDELLGEPGAAQAEMGAGRLMGTGWISVAADALDTDAGLEAWVVETLAHNRSVAGDTGRFT